MANQCATNYYYLTNMEQRILKQELMDKTEGTLYLTQNGNHYYITIENKKYPFYELLLETKLKTAAEHCFELIYNSSADPDIKNQSVDGYTSGLVPDGIPASID